MNLETFASGVFRDVRKLYQDPEFLAEFERWKEGRDKEWQERGKSESWHGSTSTTAASTLRP